MNSRGSLPTDAVLMTTTIVNGDWNYTENWQDGCYEITIYCKGQRLVAWAALLSAIGRQHVVPLLTDHKRPGNNLGATQLTR
jgi:hypothetical protein